MRKAMLAVLVATAAFAMTPAVALGAPTLTLTPKCDDPTHPYLVSVVLSGLPPGALFEGTFATDRTTFGPTFLRADQNGEFRINLGDSSPLGVVNASGFHDVDEDLTQDPGEPTFGASIANPCAEPPVPGGTVTGAGDVFLHRAFPTPTRLTIDARSGPTGENPTGSVRIATPTGVVTGTVTCVSVKGLVATIGVRLDQALPSGESAGVIDVLDYSTSTTVVRPDLAAFTPRLTVPTQCPFPVVATGFGEVTNGDFSVTAAPPVPTSKDQCKNGGWRQYGFKNQGACIAFVIHKAIKACVFEQAAIGRSAFRSKYGGGRFDLFAMLRCVGLRVDG